MARGLIPFDKRALGGGSCLVGIDEAGRGCLAGPVVAAAVLCRDTFYNSPACRQAGRGVDDSKRLNPEQRQSVIRRFAAGCHEKWIQVAVGTATVAEIERHNIYHATTLAMRRALASLDPAFGDPFFRQGAPGHGRRVVLIDGRPIRSFPFPHEGVVKGDQRSFAIALAGIHAKEHRDGLMRDLDEKFPAYRFADHKGYGTPFHLKALREHGPSAHHRKTFLRKLMATEEAAEPVTQDSLFRP